MSTALSTTRDLDELAADINREHEAAEAAAMEAIEHALEAGRALTEAKRHVAHGHWLPWLEKRTKVSPRQSQRYMRLAKNWSAIEGKYDAASHLTIDGALKLLEEPKKGANCPKLSDPPAHDEAADKGKTEFYKWCNENASDMSPDDRDELWEITKRIHESWLNIAFAADAEFVKNGERDLETEKLLGVPEIKNSKHYLEEVARRSTCKFNLPELRPDRTLGALGEHSYAEITPCPKHPGYYRVGVYHDLDTDEACVTHDKRVIHRDYVVTSLEQQKFVPLTHWMSNEFDGEEPWYVTAEGKPGRGTPA